MDKYSILGQIGEGSFSEVLKAVKIETMSSEAPHYIAIKVIKHENEPANTMKGTKEHPVLGESAKGLRCRARNSSFVALENKEVFALKLLKPHPNIIQLHDVFVDPLSLRICIVTELMYVGLFHRYGERGSMWWRFSERSQTVLIEHKSTSFMRS